MRRITKQQLQKKGFRRGKHGNIVTGNKNPKGRPRGQGLVSKKELLDSAIKHDGIPSKIALDLGIAPATVTQHLQRKPDIMQAVLDARKVAMKKAGMELTKSYKKIAAGMDANVVFIHKGKAILSDAPDFKERREAAKLSLQIMGDLPFKESEGDIINNFVFYIPQKNSIESVEDPIDVQHMETAA